MFNLKSVFAFVLVSTLSAHVSANAFVDEIVIDTADLQASISADLTTTMAKMHQEALEEATLLIADEKEATPTQQVVKTK
ncbi:hypothetical protein [Shewanella putrefaciens]|uniref:Secreted protein n=1 Tax=Shewanella putrefaciens (strain 200) TaxID=399804 RepID=E6XQD4_SHEP2|nr:hypothetical protein [Shewanella putrefaciens]MCA1896188.1 hypothetical protein [Shewanella putrefaciens]